MYHFTSFFARANSFDVCISTNRSYRNPLALKVDGADLTRPLLKKVSVQFMDDDLLHESCHSIPLVSVFSPGILKHVGPTCLLL